MLTFCNEMSFLQCIDWALEKRGRQLVPWSAMVGYLYALLLSKATIHSDAFHFFSGEGPPRPTTSSALPSQTSAAGTNWQERSQVYCSVLLLLSQALSVGRGGGG